ncbi:hypothetical protein DU19_0250 [Chlamydia muridarum]|uniref:Uncharacterized protein n=1 Tax=Chlamydia muridarum (strain MoPn / Nigg) TaxID=243161 RepID=Q9PL87_CHLMU|nr:hypothetical protein TC_0220 [Chlamydia muridarum str. Nigg]KDU80703.1 hypothetical protein DU17_0250 [Chlamydia muridarum]KDU81219.1 hypothetical protein DU18_0250 [Chlamydia muridarum]KDU82809.1 hypothetical protein DU19_0250 [Chlamydia muridarum]KDU83172.1 hypothetical protein DU20_0250 [Chlamydia muridarum]
MVPIDKDYYQVLRRKLRSFFPQKNSINLFKRSLRQEIFYFQINHR